MSKGDAAEVLAIEGREVRITHPDKSYFAREVKLSKLDLVRYYLSVAPGAIAGIRDRPLVLKRFVDGAEREPFYQKRAPDKRPPWLRTVTLSFPSGRTAEEVVMSRVFIAEEIALGRKVVVKVLPPDMAAAVSKERLLGQNESAMSRVISQRLKNCGPAPRWRRENQLLGGAAGAASP